MNPDRLEGEDAQGKPLLPELLKRYLACNTWLRTQQPHLQAFSESKRILAEAFLEELNKARFDQERVQHKMKVEEHLDNSQSSFMDKYGGRIKDYAEVENLKEKRYHVFVNEFCKKKIEIMKEALSIDYYKRMNYINLFFLLRQFILENYMNRVCQLPDSE